MQWSRSTLPFALAAAAVAGAAWLPGAGSVEAAPRTDHTRQLDVDRDLHPGRGPYFGLRVNSMDVGGRARTVACLDYACHGIAPGSAAESYQLVRHAFLEAEVTRLACDEILREAFLDAEIDYTAFVVTTRWMRLRGPSETPVGGFVGRCWVRAEFHLGGEDGRDFQVPLLDLGMIGTTGMKPGRGEGADRCDAPLHDEGWYQGGFVHKGLRRIQQAFEITDPDRLSTLRTLANALVAGTFEGEIAFAEDAESAADYCDIASQKWFFDGLVAWKCRPDHRPTDRVAPQDKPDSRGRGLERALRDRAE